MKKGKEEKKEKILQVARTIFAEKGLENTSMQSIARKAGVAKGTVYLYFESKLHLFMEVLYFAGSTVQKEVRKIADSSLSILDKLRKFQKIRLDFIQQYPEYHSILFTLYHKFNDEMLSSMKQFFAQKSDLQEWPMQILHRIILEGKKNGELRADLDPIEETFRLWFMSISMGIASNITRSKLWNHQWKSLENSHSIDENSILWNTFEIYLESLKHK